MQIAGNDICRQAIVEKKITLNSHPTIVRDFIPIDSIINVVNRLVSPRTSSPYGTIYNLGKGNSLTIGEISELVSKRCAALYGINPSINISCAGSASTRYELEYRSTKIRNARLLQDEPSLQVIVDQTLEFCMRNFG